MSNVVGTGCDLVFVPRVASAIQRWGIERFLRRIYTPEEIEQFQNRAISNLAAHIAGRIAAKEAVFKAVSRFRRLGWREFSLLSPEESRSAPKVVWQCDWSHLHMMPPIVLVSISHDKEYAMATALAYSDPPNKVF